MSDTDNAELERLRKEGRYEEAAAILLGQDRPKEAAELLASVWKWQKAAEIARNAGLFALAYRCALEGDARDIHAALADTLAGRPDDALEAARFAESKGRLSDAARLREAAGDLENAARLFTRAGDLSDAARCEERNGRSREAGMLYERRLKEDPGDADAALRLGQILVKFARWDHAARALQRAAESSEYEDRALPLLVACFDALNMDQAASAALSRIPVEDTVLTVPEFLKSAFGDERGLAGLSKGGEANELLAGRYRIARTLGAGGSGRVLLGHDGFYERAVAIKVLNVAAGARGRDSYRRFAQEAHVAAGIHHPNVVRVFEFNPDGPFLVMEFMAGGTLEDRLENSTRLPLETAQSISLSMLKGLEAVHRRGVIHRDLKPANVFFGATGDVKIGDFGVAHLQDQSSTLTGAMMGTLAYMAPEQITGREKPRAGTDLYAFGIILFRMLTGAIPFTSTDFVSAHLNETPRRASELRPALGTRFDALFEQLLAKELNVRPPSVEAVLQTMETIDWHDPDHDAVQAAVELGKRASAPSERPIAPKPETERYVLIEAREGGAYLAEDSLLGRTVRVEPCDAERSGFLRSLAKVDHPHLQAVFDVDDERGRAVLESPRGESLLRAELSSAQRLRVGREVRAAVVALHAKGLTHGALGLSNIRIGPGRAVLLLPQTKQGTAEGDLTSLGELFAET